MFDVDQSLRDGGFEALVSTVLTKDKIPAFIAVHNSQLGPPLGGVRMWPYGSVAEAQQNVLALAKGMTYKAANALLELGGGKAIILADSREFRGPKRRNLFIQFGRFVERYGGKYITAEDVGTSVPDVDWVSLETKKVVGISQGSGDPSPVTAWGVINGMKACAQQAWGSDSLADSRIAIQGCGHVGSYLIKHLIEEGAYLLISDVDEDKVNAIFTKYGEKKITSVDPNRIYARKVDIFSPNALGFVVNRKTIPQFKCRVIAGGANNQIENDSKEIEAELKAREILYAPDYVINAGGLINVNSELANYNHETAMQMAAGIHDTLLDIFATAKKRGILNSQAAAQRAKRIIRNGIPRPAVKAGI